MDWAIACADAADCENFEYAVVLKESGELIGQAGLMNVSDEPEIGWTLHWDFWRRSYGTEMGETMLRLGFEGLKLRRIIAGCNARNQGSYGVMEKIGMRREAHFIKAQQGNSALQYKWCDRYQYAMLKEEWRK